MRVRLPNKSKPNNCTESCILAVVAYVGKIKFLGYGFYKSQRGFRLRVHKKPKYRIRKRVKELTSRRYVNDYEGWKKSLKQFITGWVNYYKLTDMKNRLLSTDEWMRDAFGWCPGRSENE